MKTTMKDDFYSQALTSIITGKPLQFDLLEQIAALFLRCHSTSLGKLCIATTPTFDVGQLGGEEPTGILSCAITTGDDQ